MPARPLAPIGEDAVNDPYRPRRPWRLYVFLAVAGLVALVAAGLVVQTALAPRHPENYRIPPIPSLPGATSTTRPTGSDPGRDPHSERHRGHLTSGRASRCLPVSARPALAGRLPEPADGAAGSSADSRRSFVRWDVLRGACGG